LLFALFYLETFYILHPEERNKLNHD